MLHLKPKLIMTRPLPQSKEFAENFMQFLGQTVDVIYAPVIEVVPIEFTDQSADRFVVTSINALNIYTANSDQRGEIFCVGQKVAERAKMLGFNKVTYRKTANELGQILPQDALYLRGKNVSVEFSQDHELIIYRQNDVPLSQDVFSQITGSGVVPLFSAQSARSFANSMVDMNSGLHVIGLSETVLEPLRDLQFASQKTLENPTRDEMMQALATYYKDLPK
jgi:uroporphyrinogen-III synthase